MIRKKNGFMTFICSLVPGAGEMYLGFMKEGLSIMCLTFGLMILITTLELQGMLPGLIILWFYSLFNTHNKASLPDEEFYALEDDYLFHLDQLLPEGRLNDNQTKVFGWILLLLGILLIWRPSIQNLTAVLRVYVSSDFASLVGDYLYRLPRFVMAVILMISGIRLIRRKKVELDLESILDQDENK